MKIIILDEVELNTPGSEEFITIAVGRKNQYKSITEFWEATKQKKCFSDSAYILTEPHIESESFPDSGFVRNYLELYASIFISENSLITELAREWHELDILIEEDALFIRFYWETLA